MNLQVVRTLPEQIWRRFVDEHPEANIFHSPEMFHVFARTRSHRPELWAAVSGDGCVHSLLLPVRVSVSPLSCPLTTRAVVYGGVLRSPGSPGDEALKLLLRTYINSGGKGVLFTELRNLSDATLAQPRLRDSGFAYEDHLNYLVDLDRPVEAIFQGIGKRTRKNIRHGLNQQAVVVEEVKNGRQLGECVELIRSTYKEARVPLADHSLFEAAFDLLYPRGMARYTLARVGGIPAATSVELLYKKVVYGWYGGVNRLYGDCVPNELLMWHILQWSAERGYKTYDFGGAGKPDERYGVRDFKAKFGGCLVNFGRNCCVHSPRLLALARAGYGLLHRRPRLGLRIGQG